jgi:hypothetical protein
VFVCVGLLLELLLQQLWTLLFLGEFSLVAYFVFFGVFVVCVCVFVCAWLYVCVCASCCSCLRVQTLQRAQVAGGVT